MALLAAVSSCLPYFFSFKGRCAAMEPVHGKDLNLLASTYRLPESWCILYGEHSLGNDTYNVDLVDEPLTTY